MRTSPLTVAVATYKRPDLLTLCLQSLLPQRSHLSSVLVLDNDASRSAQHVSKRFSRLLPIRYVSVKHRGVPYVRNKALEICKTPFLAFIDDDCIADQQWASQAAASLYNKGISYVIGKSSPQNGNRPVALASFAHHDYWFHFNLSRNRGMPMAFNMDTKNVVFRMRDIRKHSLRFDVSLCLNGVDASDTDFGFQLEKERLRGIYQNDLVVYHRELTSATAYFRKGYIRGRLAHRLTNKWSRTNEFVDRALYNVRHYLGSIRRWGSEFRMYYGNQRARFPITLASFLLLKCYELAYRRGFIDGERSTHTD